jgi:hypothetical protein
METLIQRILNLGSGTNCWKPTTYQVVSQAQPSGLHAVEDEHTHTFKFVCSRVPTGCQYLMCAFI